MHRKIRTISAAGVVSLLALIGFASPASARGFTPEHGGYTCPGRDYGSVKRTPGRVHMTVDAGPVPGTPESTYQDVLVFKKDRRGILQMEAKYTVLCAPWAIWFGGERVAHIIRG